MKKQKLNWVLTDNCFISKIYFMLELIIKDFCNDYDLILTEKQVKVIAAVFKVNHSCLSKLIQQLAFYQALGGVLDNKYLITVSKNYLSGAITPTIQNDIIVAVNKYFKNDFCFAELTMCQIKIKYSLN